MPIAPAPIGDSPPVMSAYNEGFGLAWAGLLTKAGPLAKLFMPNYQAA